MKKGRKLAESYGYKVAYFVGGNIQVEGGSVRGVVDTANKTVLVRADHPDITALQIARHEMGHAAIAKGDFTLAELRERLLKDFTDAEISEMVEVYRSAYSGILSADEAFEEICCDALGKINIFAGTKQNSESYVKAQRNIRKYAAEKNSAEGRAPPETGGVKYSISEVEGVKQKYGAGVILDTDIFNGVPPRKWGNVLSRYVYENMAGAELTMYDEAGIPEKVFLARSTERVTKDGSKNSRKVIDKLAGYRGDTVRAQAIVQLPEVLASSTHKASSNEHTHQWMDENGWLIRTAYLQTQDGNIYEATLNIADGRDRKILYEVNRVHRIDKAKNLSEHTDTGEGQRSRYQEHEPGRTQSEIDTNIPNASEDVKKNTAKTAEKFSREAESDRYIVALDDANIDELKKSLTLDEAIDLLDAQTGLSYRLRSSDNPMSRAGYAMFADNIDSLIGAYGGSRPKAFSVEISALTPVSDIVQDIIDARHRTDEKTPWILENHEHLSDEEFAALFDPDDIVDSAAAYDDEDLVSWLWDNVLEPKDIIGLETYDGAIAFDTDIIKRNLPAEVTSTQFSSDEVMPLSKRFDSKNEDIRYSREQSKGKEYSGKNVDWAVENGIITEEERISFFHKVADINKLGHKYRQAKNGDYIVDLGGKLLFTNADWYSPSLNIVISFNDSFESSMLYAKEIVFNEAKSEANYNRARQAIETAYWQGYVEFSYSRNYQTNVGKNAGRERADSKANHGEDVSYSREPETLNELRRQNKVLRERVDYWKRQTKPTKVKQLRMDDIRRLAKEVVSMSETDLKPKDITEGLTELGKYLLNEPELRYTDVSKMAEDIAADVIENATAIVNEEDTEKPRFRTRLLSLISVPERG